MTPDAWLLLLLAGGAAVLLLIVVEDLLWERGFDLAGHLIDMYDYLFGGTT